jgi:hypothetical protein
MKRSICTVVSFGGSSGDGYKIVLQRTNGSKVTLTTLASITRAGMKCIPAQDLSKMCEINGCLATEAKSVIGEKNEIRSKG